MVVISVSVPLPSLFDKQNVSRPSVILVECNRFAVKKWTHTTVEAGGRRREETPITDNS